MAENTWRRSGEERVITELGVMMKKARFELDRVSGSNEMNVARKGNMYECKFHR